MPNVKKKKSGPGNKILLYFLFGFSETEFVGFIKQPFIFVTER